MINKIRKIIFNLKIALYHTGVIDMYLNIRCFLGFHIWKYIGYNSKFRECYHCNKKQEEIVEIGGMDDPYSRWITIK